MLLITSLRFCGFAGAANCGGALAGRAGGVRAFSKWSICSAGISRSLVAAAPVYNLTTLPTAERRSCRIENPWRRIATSPETTGTMNSNQQAATRAVRSMNGLTQDLLDCRRYPTFVVGTGNGPAVRP